MDISELIALLMEKQRGQSVEMKVLHGTAAGTIENLLGRVDALEAELRDERHRHDRYVDFELAEAEELRKLKEQLRWIPVTERLPEDNLPRFSEVKQIKVLTALKSSSGVRTVRSQMRYRDTWGKEIRWMWKCSGSEITHWMPLPESPKGE